MKIYRFNPETGAYLGEDFADEMAMQRGKYIVPSDATSIAPPQVEKCQLLVFHVSEQRWEVRLQPHNVLDNGYTQCQAEG